MKAREIILDFTSLLDVIMIILFSFQNFNAIRSKTLNLNEWTILNYIGQQDYQYMTGSGRYKIRKAAISGLFTNEVTLGGIKLSFVLSAIGAFLGLCDGCGSM